jgi:hypothetical protein
VERVGVGQEEEEGELETSASAASRRGIGRQIVPNGDTVLVIWWKKMLMMGGGGRKKAFSASPSSNTLCYPLLSSQCVNALCADFVSSRGAGM